MEINMASNEVSTVIDVESLAASMKKKIESNKVPLSPNNCIFKTPSILARHNPNAYIPNYFSFGPWHHKQKKFKVTEKIKIKYLADLISRLEDPELKLRECLNSIKEVEKQVRDCYAVNLDHISQDKFIEMMVIDGCFIIQLFRKGAYEVAKEHDDSFKDPAKRDDPMISMPCMMQFLSHDLILLENQIPWLVLECLFEKTKDPDTSLLELALEFMKLLCYSDMGFLGGSHLEGTNINDIFAGTTINHILDLLRLIFVLPSLQVQNYKKSSMKPAWQQIPSATRLKEAGVKFVKVERNSILDIKFESDILEIPTFVINETTETLFRNLISYEQCLPNCSTIFTSYAKMMDNLIDTTNDMETLCRKGIFSNWLSQEDATELFNKLYNGTFVTDYCYEILCRDVNSHYLLRWPRWRAAYVQNYFTKPWAVVAQIYAIIIFILTFWQAYKSG